MSDKYQLWGTFSVKDHVNEGAFIAEVLMYDYLVVPIPPKRDPADKEKTKEAEIEWQRWKDQGWDPGRQTQMLAILGDLAVPVEWTERRRDLWEKMYKLSRQSVAKHLAGELAFQVTGDSLLDVVPAMAEGVVAVAPYRSLEELKVDLGIRERALALEDPGAAPKLPSNVLSAVLGREFLVPENPDKDDFELLYQAVKVARTADYREARAALYAFQRKFLSEDRTTDVESITEAVKAMHKHLEDLQRATGHRRFWDGVRRCFFFSQIAINPSSAVGLITPVVAEVGKAAISLGKFTTSEMLANPSNLSLPRTHVSAFWQRRTRRSLSRSPVESMATGDGRHAYRGAVHVLRAVRGSKCEPAWLP